MGSLREAAEADQRPYAEIVLEAVSSCRSRLLSRFAGSEQSRQDDDPLLRRPRRRRRARDGDTIQLTLYLAPHERAALDDLAERTGMARSQLVTKSLQCYLQGRHL